jgi:hypothetical protein
MRGYLGSFARRSDLVLWHLARRQLRDAGDHVQVKGSSPTPRQSTLSRRRAGAYVVGASSIARRAG